MPPPPPPPPSTPDVPDDDDELAVLPKARLSGPRQRGALTVVAVLTAAALVAVLTAERLTMMELSASEPPHWGSHSATLSVVVAVAFVCIVVAPPLIHGVIGRDWHHELGYAIFQPFVGGWRFVLLQMIGWTLYGATLASFFYVFYVVLQRSPLVTGTMLFSGFGVITAELCLFVSLKYFQRQVESDDFVKSAIAFALTAVAYSMPLLTTLLLLLPPLLLPTPLYLAVMVPAVIRYSSTYKGRPHHTGSRSWPAFRNSRYWSYFEHYFQLKVVSNGNLRKDALYLMGYHPHGIYPFTTMWATRGEQWRSTFPGVEVDVLGASVLYYVPVLRDIAMWGGGRDVSRQSIQMAFRHNRSVMLVPGGEREMRETRPESKQEVLVSRHKGFVRLALEHGVHLVPVFGFGESKLLDNFRAKNIQDWFAKRTFYGMPHMPYGRFYSPMPNAVPMTLVVGDPIPVPKVHNITDEILNKYHRLYFDRLRELFDKHKGSVAGYKDSTIVYPDFGEVIAD